MIATPSRPDASLARRSADGIHGCSRTRARSSPLPDPLESTWAHAALHFTSQASDAVSDLLIMQSAIPTTYLVFYGQSLLARLKMLKAMQGAISLGKLIDQLLVES